MSNSYGVNEIPEWAEYGLYDFENGEWCGHWWSSRQDAQEHVNSGGFDGEGFDAHERCVCTVEAAESDDDFLKPEVLNAYAEALTLVRKARQEPEQWQQHSRLRLEEKVVYGNYVWTVADNGDAQDYEYASDAAEALAAAWEREMGKGPTIVMYVENPESCDEQAFWVVTESDEKPVTSGPELDVPTGYIDGNGLHRSLRIHSKDDCRAVLWQMGYSAGEVELIWI